MRWFDYLALIAIIVAATTQFLSGGDGTAPPPPAPFDSPRRPAPQQFAEPNNERSGAAETETRPARPPEQQHAAPYLGLGVVREEYSGNPSTGSAFPILADGTWLTARHVAQNCRQIRLRLGEYVLRVSHRILHPGADIAVLRTRAKVTPFPLSTRSYPHETAYHIGFPRGRPGVVASGFLGEMTMRHKGRHNYHERVYVWAEKLRYPHWQGSLGGLSGGAVLTPEGRILGVVQAESRRRGRIMTSMPQRLSEIAKIAAITLPESGAPGTPIAPEKFGETGFALIDNYRIAKVLCGV